MRGRRTCASTPGPALAAQPAHEASEVRRISSRVTAPSFPPRRTRDSSELMVRQCGAVVGQPPPHGLRCRRQASAAGWRRTCPGAAAQCGFTMPKYRGRAHLCVSRCRPRPESRFRAFLNRQRPCFTPNGSPATGVLPGCWTRALPRFGVTPRRRPPVAPPLRDQRVRLRQRQAQLRLRSLLAIPSAKRCTS